MGEWWRREEGWKKGKGVGGRAGRDVGGEGKKAGERKCEIQYGFGILRSW